MIYSIPELCCVTCH